MGNGLLQSLYRVLLFLFLWLLLFLHLDVLLFRYFLPIRRI